MSSRTPSSGAWRNAARYVAGRGSVKTWLLAIVHHRAIDAIRRRKATVELPDVEVVPPPQFQAPDVWAEVSAQLDADDVRRAIATLSDVQREAIELAYFGGLTQQEVADRTATPLGTVKSRMRLGLLAMRRVLTPDDQEAESMTDLPSGGLTCDEVRDLAAPFVLGALDADEQGAVREHLATCAEPHPEFAELGSVVPALRVERDRHGATGRVAGPDHGRGCR